jgi:hypothetical protein
MILTQTDQLLSLSTSTYTLTFAADRPFIYLDDSTGRRLAELFPLSSIHPLHGRDETTLTGTWQVRQTADEVVFSLDATSSVWQAKRFRFRCRDQRFTYEVELEGVGQLVEANYFGGYYSGQVSWGAGFFWSGQNFSCGFNPEPNKEERIHFDPRETVAVDLMGVSLPGKRHWFFTPAPFCFGLQGPHGWVGMGVEAPPGAHRYTEYQYHGAQGGFYLGLSFEGHTTVSGRYQLPAIGFDFAEDEYALLEKHIQALVKVGVLNSAESQKSWDWWRQPIFCGWGAQCYLEHREGRRAADYATQERYESFLLALEQNGVDPGIIVLDDKWQSTYGENRVDHEKWPQLPDFIAQQHATGRRVILWLKAWDPEGLPPEECIRNAAGLPVSVDPTHPAYERRLRNIVQELLSPEGLDADGFKIDFTARFPSGPGSCLHGDLWGLELLRHYLAIIYSAAKQAKPDALVMTHTPHAYLADVLDMIRLNDINKDEDIPRAMRHRARVARIACPQAIIDTDNWPMPHKTAWRSYLDLQADLGVPSLYFATHIDFTGEPLEAEDYASIRASWDHYRSGLRDYGDDDGYLPLQKSLRAQDAPASAVRQPVETERR